MKNRIIIFGSGQVGHDALMFFGSEYIECFCDNNGLLAGTEKYGKQVIPFEKLKKEYSDCIVMIAAAGNAAYEIAEQCEDNGIPDYLVYRQLWEAFPEYDRTEMLHFISDSLNRMYIRKELYRRLAAQRRWQVDYFKSHADIRHMKPAAGKLKLRQEQCVRTSSTFFEKIEKLEIKPILYGGNLLGYVRHGGFIPWDDDIDFALIRGEYERLKTFCRGHIKTEEEWHKKTGGDKKEILPGFACYYWHLWHDHFSVVENGEDGYIAGMDFFPLEYYADHYSMGELSRLAAQVRDAAVCKNIEEEKIQCMQRALEKNRKNTAEKSSQIYFGLDNMDLYSRFHRGQFIPKDVVFPLRKVLWEGENFWVPNKAEEFLAYEYEHPWDFPDDVGIPLHHNLSREEM